MSKALEKCLNCGLEYNDFRTGMTFADVRALLWVSNSDPSTWRHKRRHTVLGLWREIKLNLWEQHLDMCGEIVEVDPVDDY